MKIKIENVNVYIEKAPLGKEQGLPIPVKTVPTKCDVGCEVKTGDKTEIVFSKFADRTGKDGIETDE